MKDPGGQVAALEAPVGVDWWRRLRHSNAVRFSLFFALMQFGVAIASPFFTVYILRDLGFSYFEFTLNSGSSILAQFLTLSQWGRISDIFGNRRILTVTGLFIPIMPLLWTLSTDVWYLVAVQALTGFSWAGFTLAAGNFVYDLIRPDLRATFLAVHSVLAAVGTFGGAILGGFLATLLPNEATVFGKHYVWVSPLFGVFVLSTLVRGSAVLFLLPKLREVRSVRPISTSQVIFRVMRINALAGIIFDIVGSRRPRSDETNGRS
jgi:MFS family permease